MSISASERLQLAPSILTMDFARLGEEVRAVARFVDWFHLDVMDGHYVPNITFGASVVEAVRRSCDRALHVHLMIQDPASFADVFAKAGADRISFHPEVTENPGAVIDRIAGLGVGVGMAVHPDVDVAVIEPHLGRLDVVLMMSVRPGFGGQAFIPEVLPKIRRARDMIDEAGAAAEVEVDGGVNLTTLDDAVGAGGQILVAGSAIFDGMDPESAARRLRERLDGLQEGRGT